MPEQAEERTEQAAHGHESVGIVSFGDTVKAVSADGDLVTVGAYGIRFGSEEERDLQGEWFAPDTDFGPRKGDGVVTMFHHGVPLKAELAGLAERTFAPVKTVADDIGIFVEAVLDKADAYQAAIASLVERGKLRWSSGTAGHVARTDPETGKILRWHPIEFSYTPTAAEPRLPAIAPVKALVDVDYPDLQAAPEGAVPETAPAAATAVTVNVYLDGEALKAQSAEKKAQETPTSVEDMTMTDEVKTAPAEPAVDFEAMIASAVAKTAEAIDNKWKARLEAEPAINTNKAGHVVVTEDRSDRALKGSPYKTFGEFLLDVASAGGAHGTVPERLQPLRSTDSIDENGFNMAKAMGAGFVGSLTRSGLYGKAPSGLNETVPAEGGFLVGTDRTSGILSRVYDVGQVLQRVDMVGVSATSNGMTFYAEDESSRVAGSRRGGIRAYWTGEAGTLTGSQPKFRELELKLRKVTGLVYATDELLADAGALESWILRNLPEELRFVVEDAIINGDGVGKPQGILNSAALVSVTKETNQAADTIVSQNVLKMWSRRWLGGRDYVWLVNQDCGPQLNQMSLGVGTGGAVLYMPPGGLSAAPYGTLMGRPVLEVEYCATVGTVGDIMLLSLGEFQMIEKGGMESASSMHVRFVYGENTYRFIYRCDGVSKWSAPLTPLKGSNTVSPFIALASRD